MSRLVSRIAKTLVDLTFSAFFAAPAAAAKKKKEPVKSNADIPAGTKRKLDTASTEEPVLKKTETDPALKGEKEAIVEAPIAEEDGNQIKISGVPVIPGTSMPYVALTNTFEKLEATPKRLEINAICAEFFHEVLKVAPHELSKVTYLFINRLGPDYEGLELGLGESLIMKALGEATGKSMTILRNEYRKAGDLGLVALQAKSAQSFLFAAPKPLTVDGIFGQLKEIAQSSGSASQSRKIDIIKKLFTACKGSEAKFLVRSLEGKLRIGVAEKSVLVGLSQAFTAYEREKAGKKGKPTAEEISKGEELIKEAFSQVPNYEVIINAIIENGIQNVSENCKVSAGIPLKPMLAKPTKSITEVLDRFHGEKFTCEYKYDGERAQIHSIGDGTFRVYSRNMEDMTQRYPDIVSILPKICSSEGKSFIIDAEAVAWDREAKKILPFQVLSTRKRKDVEEGSIKVRVCLFAFDLLFYDGESLLQKSLTQRREILKQEFKPLEGGFGFAKSMDSDDIEEIQIFLDESVKDACEGLMVKLLDGTESAYEPSARSRNWLKLKKDYLSGVGDSLDLVVLGGYFGRGKRTNWYGGFLLGSYNAENEEYETVCKIGTGFSEVNLEEFHKTLSQTASTEPKSYVRYTSGAEPDVWFEPKMVWEVLTADLSLSPVYKAGIDELGKGVSLRFPRFIRVRDDKGPEDATSSSQIVELYNNQAHQAS